MKKLYPIILLSAILVAGVLYGGMRYYQSTYPERLFSQFTGIAQYTLRSTIYTQNDAYAEATISGADTQSLLTKYLFKPYPVNWDLKLTCPFIPDNDKGFLYHQEVNKQKPHWYTLCFLQPKTNVVIVYQYREK